MKQKFYKCTVCGQIIAMVKQTAIPVMCCGKPMQEIIDCIKDTVEIYKILKPIYNFKAK